MGELLIIPPIDNNESQPTEMMDIFSFISSKNYNIDNFMIDRFWSSLNDDELIYIDDEIISWMGYAGADARARKKNFTYSLDAFVKDRDYFDYSNADYIQFRNNHIEKINGGYGRTTAHNIYPPCDVGHGKGKTRHLLLTTDTLRQIMMTVTTAKGKKVRTYYIAIERLIKDYCVYTREYIIAEKDRAAQIDAEKLRLAEVKNFSIQNFITNVKRLEKNESIYVCTTKEYASTNAFKIGRTGDIKSRLTVYNSGRLDGDGMYYVLIIKCHDSKTLENRIKSKLNTWRSNKKKEMFILHFHALAKIIKRIADNENIETDDINEFIEKEYQDTLNLPPFIPPPIEQQKLICSGEDAEVMLTVRLPMSKVREIITQLIEANPQEEYKWKELAEKIKNVLADMNKVSKFRTREWQPICDEIIAGIGKKLSKK